jgi:hypothetical protein
MSVSAVTVTSAFTGQRALQQQQQQQQLHLKDNSHDGIDIMDYPLASNLVIDTTNYTTATTKSSDNGGISIFKVTKVRQKILNDFYICVYGVRKDT